MKSVITLLLFLFSGNSFAETGTLFASAYGERSDESDGYGATMGVYGVGDPILAEQYALALYGGVSFSKLQSIKDLEANNRKEISPVYIFGGIKIDYFITPFAELGIDLGDFILDQIFSSGEDSENVSNSVNDDVDSYLSLGINLELMDSVGLSLYHRWYFISYYDRVDTTQPFTYYSDTIPLSGVNLYMNF